VNRLDAHSRDIAIIGMACRFPGAGDWRSFWRNLREGVESIVPLGDAELLASGVDAAMLRQPNYVKAAAAIEDFDCFDAAFFEYSRREAKIIDPQHRLFLQTAWEALEDGGYWGNGYKGAIGVFAGAGGIVSSQFAANPALRGTTGGAEHIGNDKDFIATRVSYKLDLRGPSMTVQTACSTSMVAVHLACSSILNGECDMAIAGAATVRIPQRAGYLAREGDIHSPDGHCRAFDAEARGTVFGSGAGALLLKHLSDAVADGDHVYAVIRATAVNNDGAGKMSFTASSVPGQAKAMLEALSRSGVEPDSIGYVETHGTGTVIGDPLEIEALGRAFRTGTDRTQYCAVGSVKTNIGHVEQAAGVAALIKAALALYHREIPPSLNYRTPNPRIDFEASPFFVNAELRAWPTGAGPRRAAVNCLGLGGTNGFAILEEAPVRAADAVADPRTAHILTLSATSEAALHDLAGRWRERMAAEEQPVADLCHTSNVGRAEFPARMAIVGAKSSDFVAQLDPAGLKSAQAGERRKLAFLFPGQGSQYAGMTSELYQTHPVFRTELERCEAALRPHLECSLLDILFRSGGDKRLLDQTGYTQPALFAVEWSLARLWMSWGVRPDALIGHSLGEYVAACVAGVYTVEQGLQLVAHRARLMQSLPPGGAMAALFADGAAVDGLLKRCGRADVGVAAYNAPLNTVISGTAEGVAAVLAQAGDVSARRLPVSHAFHSHLMLPVLDDLEAVAAKPVACAPQIPVISNLTATSWSAAPTPAYWREHALRPVNMAASIRRLAEDGVADFVEVGPGSALVSMARQTLGPGARGARFLPSIAGDSEWRSICGTLASLWRSGAPVDWKAFARPFGARRVSAPTYPFRRERHWLDIAIAPEIPADALLGRRIESPLPVRQFESVYSLNSLPWLTDHRIFGHAVLPAAAVLVALTQMGRDELHLERGVVAGLVYRQALVVPEEAPVVTQILLHEGRALECELASRSGASRAKWSRNAGGRIVQDGGDVDTPALMMSGRAPALAEGLLKKDPADFYAALAGLGLNYGPAFRNIAELWLGEGVAVSRVVLPSHLCASEHLLHPALLDACLHVYPALAPEYRLADGATPAAEATYLPVSVERFEIRRAHLDRVFVYARRRLHLEAEGLLVVDIDIFSEDGEPAARLHGLTLRPLTAKQVKPSTASDAIHELRWVEAPAPTAAPPTAAWLVVESPGGICAGLADRLGADGATVRSLAIEPDSRADRLETSIRAAMAGLPSGTGIVLAHGLSTLVDERFSAIDMARAEEELCRTTLHLIQALSAVIDSGEMRPKVWLVTRRAQSATPAETETDPLQAALWGLGRVAAIEQARFWNGLIDIAGEDDLPALAAELGAGDGEGQVVCRASRRYVPRLASREAHTASADAAPSQPAGAWLITGGLGALGLRVARWAVEQCGARHLVLTARNAPGEKAASEIAALRTLGAEVVVRGMDVCREEDVAALIASIEAGPLRLTSVFHCAGVLDDGILIQMDWEKFRRVTAPKVLGGWLLHRYTRQLPLQNFVVFSSVLSITGAMGQANYAAGNAFLDGLVERRRALGLPAQTINWGPWADAGLAVSAGDRGRALWRSRGTDYIEPDHAMDLMASILAGGLRQSIVSLSDWSRWAQLYDRPPALFQSVVQKRADAAPARRVDRIAIGQRLAAAEPLGRRAVLAEVVVEVLRSLLEIEGDLATARPLREVGLDSLMAITLANQLEDALGQRLATAVLLKGPSVDQIVEELASRMTGEAAGAARSAARAIQMQGSV
jgi:acyl transferase domain-containing protein